MRCLGSLTASDQEDLAVKAGLVIDAIDPCLGYFKQPGAYRRSGWSTITVMDTCCPDDDLAVSNDEKRCDGILDSWNDLVIRPCPPGECRPGYSFDPCPG